MASISSALVVGGGIVGLVTARAPALKGVMVTLLERKPTIADEGGIGIGMPTRLKIATATIGTAILRARRCDIVNRSVVAAAGAAALSLRLPQLGAAPRARTWLTAPQG